MHIYRSPIPDVDLPEIPITELVLRRSADLGDHPALIDGPTGRTYTFSKLKELVHSFAGGLAARGFGPGTTLAIMAPNIPEYAIVFHGVAVAGGTISTVNPTYGAEEVAFQLRDSGASMIVTIAMFLDTAKEAATQSGISHDDVFLIGEGEGAASMNELFGAPIEQVPVDVHGQAVVLPYSSGTTGMPKGVELTHHNLTSNILQTEALLPLDEGESGLAVLPFFHIYGMQVLMNGLLTFGATVVSMPRFDLVQALQLVQDRKITRFFAVPPIVLALAKQPVVDNYDLSSLKQVFSGAAPLGAELAEEASARVGCPVVQGYGMTELSPVSHIVRPGDPAPGTVGVTAPNTECRLVVPETGLDAEDGGAGELWVRGPQVMKGYLNNPGATAATIDEDGWLHTGDVGQFDAGGRLSIVDRVKELIKYKGFQVPPAELEALLVTYPGVLDVAVIGIADEEAGELPKAYVVRKPDSNVTMEDLQAYVAQHLANYKQIRLCEFVDEIPKSASGKILRRLLRDQNA